MRTLIRTLPLLVLSAFQAMPAMAEILPGNSAEQLPLVDTASQLAWYGFEDRLTGEQAGYRLATVNEFTTLLNHAGYRQTSVDGMLYYMLDQAIKADVPGIDAYFTPGAAGSLVRHDYDLAWVAAGADLRLVGVTDEYMPSPCPGKPAGSCGGLAYSQAFVGSLASTPGIAQMWLSYTKMTGGTGVPDAPNFMMVRAVPEPASYVLMGLGLLGVGALQIARKKAG